MSNLYERPVKVEEGKKKQGKDQRVLWNKHLKTRMRLQPTTFKCSFVFKLEELLVSQHRNMSFFVSAFDTSGKREARPRDIC